MRRSSTAARRIAAILIAATSIAAAPACTQHPSSSSIVPVPPRQAFGAAPHLGGFVASPGATGQLIYGCSQPQFECVWFRKGHDAVAGAITGLSDPDGIGVDPNTGDVFITNAGASDILKFAPNSTTLLATFADPGQFPNDVAVAGNGDVYVSNVFTTTNGPGSVSVYDPNGNLLRTLTNSRVKRGMSVAVDEHNDLVFCFNNTTFHAECDDFPGGRGQGTVRVSGLKFAGGSTFDNAEHLVVLDEPLEHLLTFDGPTQCGKASFANAPIPQYIALDRPNQLLYLADVQSGLVFAYGFRDCINGTLSPVAQYNTGLPGGVLISVAVTPGVRP